MSPRFKSRSYRLRLKFEIQFARRVLSRHGLCQCKGRGKQGECREQKDSGRATGDICIFVHGFDFLRYESLAVSSK